MVKGQMGNTKGHLQVLWQSVFMDTSKDVCTYYTLHGRDDNYCNTIVETSLRELMQNCLNFIEEETLLQKNYCKIGEGKDHVIVNRTPKCHPKISGEGIEYYWGYENDYYRRLSLDKRI